MVILLGVMPLVVQQPVLAQTVDSAGVRITSNSGTDRELDWSAEKILRIGEEDGELAFFRLFPWNIKTDAQGRIYALDVGDARVRVFSSDGDHIRDLGRQGGGPGEFLRPQGLSVEPDGEVTVLDAGKSALVRFDPDGLVREQIGVEPGRAGVHKFGRDLVLSAWQLTEESLLRWHGPNDSVTIADLSLPRRDVSFPGCSIGMSGMRPFFEPRVNWAAADSRVVVNQTVRYEVDIYENGEFTSSIRRDILPIEMTRAAALQVGSVSRGMTIRHSSGECRVEPGDLLEARGWAPRASPIEAVLLAPNSQLWVARVHRPEGRRSVDVFHEPTGEYLGTLSDNVPLPSAFIDQNRFVTMDLNEDGVGFVAVWEYQAR